MATSALAVLVDASTAVGAVILWLDLRRGHYQKMRSIIGETRGAVASPADNTWADSELRSASDAGSGRILSMRVSALLATALCGVVVMFPPAGACGAQDARQPVSPMRSYVDFLQPALSLGSEDKGGPTLFGVIADVALDSALNIYVLDYDSHEIREFSKSGDFVASAGRPGRGPGDLFEPWGLYHDGHRNLYVADRINGVSRFRTDSGHLHFQNRFASGYETSDICVVGDRVLVGAWRDSHLVHEFTPQGELSRSFGGAWSADTNVFVRALANSRGLRLACDVERKMVYITTQDLGIVRAYSLDGTLDWEQRLPQFDAVTFEPYATHATVVFHKDVVMALTRLGHEFLVASVQVRNYGKGSGARTRASGGRLWSEQGGIVYLLSARTGEVLSWQEGSILLTDARSSYAVGFQEDPFPRAFLLQWRTPRE